MKRINWILLAALLVLCSNALAAKKDNCIACHDTLDAKNSAIVKGYRNDIHFQQNFSCAGCHGGDPSLADMDAMDPSKGFIGKPAHKDIPHVCGKCHSDYNIMRHYNPAIPVDQEEKYADSQHGKLLAKGDQKVAVCISCHGVHGILPVADTHSPVHHMNVPATCAHCHSDKAYMATYGIPTTQYEQYKVSVHGVAALEKQTKGAPVCNDCHGNHGAAPPGVSDIAAVCRTCHSSNGELFNQSPHKDAFKTLGISECAACHTAHNIKHPTDDMLGVAPGAVCIDCHKQGDAGYREADRMKRLLDSLITGEQTAKVQLARARALDMDVSDGETALEGVRENLIACRTAIHAFTSQHLAEVAKKGFGAEELADSLAIGAVKEHGFRRSGFGIATLAITGLALLLYLKIRQIERRQRQKQR